MMKFHQCDTFCQLRSAVSHLAENPECLSPFLNQQVASSFQWAADLQLRGVPYGFHPT